MHSSAGFPSLQNVRKRPRVRGSTRAAARLAAQNPGPGDVLVPDLGCALAALRPRSEPSVALDQHLDTPSELHDLLRELREGSATSSDSDNGAGYGSVGRNLPEHAESVKGGHV